VKVQTSSIWFEDKGPDTEQKNVKTGQNDLWPISRATSRPRGLLNKRATEALRNGKIRECIAFDFQHGPRMCTWFVNFLDKKAKIIF